MGLLYYTFDSNVTYSTLRINGTTYPSQGVLRGVYDASIDPSSTSGWKGPWYDIAHNKVTKIIIENNIEVIYGNSLFYGLEKVQTIEGLEYITGGILNASKMFSGLKSLTHGITIANLNTVNCTNMENMFSYTGVGTSINKIDLSSNNLGNLTNATQMFKNCNAKEIDMQTCNTSKIVLAKEMFANCSYLTNIYGTQGQFSMSSVSTDTDMFLGSNRLPNYTASKVGKEMAISEDSGGYISMSAEVLTTVQTRVKLKYDTRANWLKYDPVLLSGEVGIESDYRKFKVGDGAHTYSNLSYYGGADIDNKTILETSEGVEYIPIDDDTIYVDTDGLMKAKKAKGDNLTVYTNASDGSICLHLDGATIHTNASGELETIVGLDNNTIIKNASGDLEVPIDGSTIYVDTDGKVKAKGQVTPGKALEWNSSNPTTLDVKLDDATVGIQGTGSAAGYISVNYDGGTIYWDSATPGMFGNGALRAQQTRSNGDGTIVETLDGHDYKLSVPIDNDTIYLDSGVIKAKQEGSVKDVKVNNVTVVDSQGVANIPLATMGNAGALYVTNARGLEFASGVSRLQVANATASGITNRPAQSASGYGVISTSNFDAAVKAALTDGIGAEYTEDEKKAARERIGADQTNVDGRTIIETSEGIAVAIDNNTIIYNESEGWIEVHGEDLTPERGLYIRDDSEGHYIGIRTDLNTLDVTSEGALTVIGANFDNKTIQKIDGKNAVAIDNNTLVYNDSEAWVEVHGQDLSAENGLYFRETSEGAAIGVLVDNETITVNSEGKLVGTSLKNVDEKTIISNEGVIAVNIDNESIVYNSSEDYVEVNGYELVASDGLAILGGDNCFYIKVKLDGKSVTLNDNGELQADSLPKPYGRDKFLHSNSEGTLDWLDVVTLFDNKTIVKNEKNEIEVAIDNETIIYNSESKVVEVNNKDLVTSYPAAITTTSESYVLTTLFDNETIVLNNNNELCTAAGGGYTKKQVEVVIASGGSSKIRHHSLPSDFADYSMLTVNFPSIKEYGTSIDCVVSSNISGCSSVCELNWNSDELYWEGTCGTNTIIVKEDGSLVQTSNEFESAQSFGNVVVKTNAVDQRIIYIDNTFIKTDGKTITVNSEGELQSFTEVNAGKGIIIDSEGKINVNPGQGLGINLTTNKVAALDATKNVKGVAKIDDVTIKKNADYQLYVDITNMVDRGLDVTNNKIGHTNSITAGSKGSKWAVPEIEYDAQGHITNIEDQDIPTVLGASASKSGERGFVPAPAAGQQNCFLRGDGQWTDLVGSGLFSVISTTNSWYAGTDRRSCVFTSAPSSGQTVIAPLGFSVDKDTEGIDVIYPIEYTTGHITLSARSNTQSDIKVTATCYWLVIKAS